MYSNVCGFTGTVGDENDISIYHNEYNMEHKKLPRYKPSLRFMLPMILCKDKNERNNIIISEVLAFHRERNPILVIFQDLKEIDEVKYRLYCHKIHKITIFDGKDEQISPDDTAGQANAISLGTNFCGRGANIIQKSDKPLHVIVAYYSKSRVMNQAFGRTARQGKKGSCRVICLASQYYDSINDNNNENCSYKAIAKDFDIKNDEQNKFIKRFKLQRPWIFSGDIKKQTLDDNDLRYLRRTQINVNRIIAYNFEFPICMSYETFLDIQAQKIFSIFNCPNSKYTWILFQRYVREMILESWSLMMDEVDHSGVEIGTEEYQNELQKGIVNLCKKLDYYLPESKAKGIVPTFMHIFKRVVNIHQDDTMKQFEGMIRSKMFKFADKKSLLLSSREVMHFCSLNLGFRPYSLLTKSGARINSRRTDIEYIIDPELKYQRQLPENKFSWLSITERIDKLFNKICQKINEFLGELFFLKFFLRRTLAGCEFGICIDFRFYFLGKKHSSEEKNILIDTEPLLVFTINVRSLMPVLAGILLIVLVYAISISGKIAEWISEFPLKFTGEFIKKGMIKIICNMAPELIGNFLDKTIDFLKNLLDKQIDKLKKFNENAAAIIDIISSIFCFDNKTVDDKIGDILGDLGNIRINLGIFEKKMIDAIPLFKIGLLLLFCLGTFMMNFYNHRKEIKYIQKVAKDLDSKYNDESVVNKLSAKNKSKIKIEGNLKNSSEENYKIVTSPFIDSYLFIMHKTDLSEFQVSSTEFGQDSEFKLNRDKTKYPKILARIQESTKKKCFLLKFDENDDRFMKNVIFHATNHPAISEFLGYAYNKNQNYIYIERKGSKFLDEEIYNNSLNETSKLIISYGIAQAMNFLHKNNIILLSLIPSNIALSDEYHPYILDFCYATLADKKPSSSALDDIKEKQYFPPEYLLSQNWCTKSFDVFSYGILMYNLFHEKKIDKNIQSEERPKLAYNLSSEMFSIIRQCWKQKPEERITFDQICKELESIKVGHKEPLLDNYKKEFI
ncbi:hypothetical protein M9Y10_038918 [Tritrichomonas musculus]|uniref:Protein kinase domain-containing protein n=1 Tax=Tritrichomonas musculus TaxID=1915356 RepID=A0ABR2K9X2_9EUKA